MTRPALHRESTMIKVVKKGTATPKPLAPCQVFIDDINDAPKK